jgi:hypothetical protein
VRQYELSPTQPLVLNADLDLIRLIWIMFEKYAKNRGSYGYDNLFRIQLKNLLGIDVETFVNIPILPLSSYKARHLTFIATVSLSDSAANT